MLQDMFAAIEKATQKVDYEYTLSDEFEASGGDVLYVTVSH